MLIRDENKSFQYRLRNQHPIERIAMRAGQGARNLSVQKADRKSRKSLIPDSLGEIGDDAGDTGQLSDAVLRRYLPRRCRADKDSVVLIRYRGLGDNRERIIAGQPP